MDTPNNTIADANMENNKSNSQLDTTQSLIMLDTSIYSPRRQSEPDDLAYSAFLENKGDESTVEFLSEEVLHRIHRNVLTTLTTSLMHRWLHFSLTSLVRNYKLLLRRDSKTLHLCLCSVNHQQ